MTNSIHHKTEDAILEVQDLSLCSRNSFCTEQTDPLSMQLFSLVSVLWISYIFRSFQFTLGPVRARFCGWPWWVWTASIQHREGCPHIQLPVKSHTHGRTHHVNKQCQVKREWSFKYVITKSGKLDFASIHKNNFKHSLTACFQINHFLSS